MRREYIACADREVIRRSRRIRQGLRRLLRWQSGGAAGRNYASFKFAMRLPLLRASRQLFGLNAVGAGQVVLNGANVIGEGGSIEPELLRDRLRVEGFETEEPFAEDSGWVAYCNWSGFYPS